MRCYLLLLAWGLASNTSSWAQVKVEVALDQQEYLPNESLVASVRITNLSGQKLLLGDDPHWLRFSIEGREGAVTPRLGDAPVLGEFSLESSQVATKLVELAPYFDLSLPRRYQLTAVVRVARWGQEFASRPQDFSIIRGTKFWEQ
jgi:hypothetical protein